MGGIFCYYDRLWRDLHVHSPFLFLVQVHRKSDSLSGSFLNR
jgi:hypothetical protein